MRIFFVTLYLSLSLATTASAQSTPHGNNRSALTYAEYQSSIIDLERGTMIDAYLREDPSHTVDDEVVELLRLAGHHYGSTSRESEMAELVQRLGTGDHESGIVRAVSLVRLSILESPPDGLGPKLLDAILELESSGYPAWRLAGFSSSLLNHASAVGDRELRSVATDMMNRLQLRACASDNHSTTYRRLMWSKFVRRRIEDRPRRERQAALQELEAEPGIDSWILETAKGLHFNEYAWEERGGAYGAETTNEKFRRFEKYLGKAVEHLERAWQLAPMCPEAPALLIKASMGGVSSPGTSEWVWFQRAVAGQIDHRLAHNAYRYSLLPRWGGSLDQIEEFGLLCAEPERQGTLAAFQTAYAFGDIVKEAAARGDDDDQWVKRVRLVRAMQVALGPGLEKMPNADLKWSNTAWTVASWKLGDFSAAAAGLDALDGVLLPKALRRIGVQLSGLDLDLRIPTHASDDRDRVVLAESLQAEGNWSAAAELWAVLVDELPDAAAPSLRAALNSRAQIASWVAQFESGEPVNLIPDASLSGLAINAGDWTLEEDGLLAGRSNSKSGQISVVYRAPFGDRYRLEGTVWVKNPFWNPSCFGFMFDFGFDDISGRDRFRTALYWPRIQNATCGLWGRRAMYEAKTNFVMGTHHRSHTLLLIRDGDTVYFEFDGKVVADGRVPFVTPGREAEDPLVGLMGQYLGSGKFMFSDITITKLEVQPEIRNDDIDF